VANHSAKCGWTTSGFFEGTSAMHAPQAYPSAWTAQEHLLLAAYIFPLLVKLRLAEAGSGLSPRPRKTTWRSSTSCSPPRTCWEQRRPKTASPFSPLESSAPRGLREADARRIRALRPHSCHDRRWCCVTGRQHASSALATTSAACARRSSISPRAYGSNAAEGVSEVALATPRRLRPETLPAAYPSRRRLCVLSAP